VLCVASNDNQDKETNTDEVQNGVQENTKKKKIPVGETVSESVQTGPGVILGLKRPRRGADHLPPRLKKE
jgi:hypothetical protein